MRLTRRSVMCLWAVLFCAGLAWSSAVAAPNSTPPFNIDTHIAERSKAIVDDLAGPKFDEARQAAVELFDQAAIYAPANRTQLFRDAAYPMWLGELVRTLDAEQRKQTLAYLRKNDALGRMLAYMVHDSENDPAAVCALLMKLAGKYGDKLNDYPDFTAAFCVVHDKHIKHRINENSTEAADPMEIADYYFRNEKQMIFGLKAVPAELARYMVNTAVPIDQMEWALKNYGKDPKVGKHFHTIKYDYDSLKGSVKKVTAAGFSLPNIKKYGGVCADQSYFCVAIGKSIGIPTAYTSARSGAMGHAWVGFLDAQGQRMVWNAAEGRFGAYLSLRGDTSDPQSGAKVAEGDLSMITGLMGIKAADRHATAALIDAARRINNDIDTASGVKVVPPAEGAIAARKAGSAGAEQLLEAGLRLCPTNQKGWIAVREMAEKDQLPTSQKNIWADRVLKLCAAKAPDFCVETLKPMISSIKEIPAQNALWELIYKKFDARKDLAAEIRFTQGEMWSKAGDPKKAGLCYNDVVEKFPNAGPFVISALKRTEEMLIKSGLEKNVVRAYAEAWAKTEKPKEKDLAPGFFTQSNWFNVGKLYAQKLAASGDMEKAKEVAEKVESASGTKIKLAAE